MSNNAVTKGLKFEIAIEKMLNEYGLQALRTNKTNQYDPVNYKHGFDGGVDIIATFKHGEPHVRHYDFYIQCKNHKNGITKQAISEVYAGMHARHADNSYSVPVVIAYGEVSKETRQYAKELGVELLLDTERKIIKDASLYKTAKIDDYGILVKALLYHCTQNNFWLKTMPDNKNYLSEKTPAETLLQSVQSEYIAIESSIETAERFRKQAFAEQQKALEIQKKITFNVVKAMINTEKRFESNHTIKKEKPTIIEDSG